MTELDHREYVGGLWDQMGKLQFNFLLKAGLKPEHVLLDVACGSLRAGSRFIPYLNKGNYLGIEKNALVLDKGIKEELGQKLLLDKNPHFVVSSIFDFQVFPKRPDYAIAQSLFTHLTPPSILLCLKNLKAFAPDVKFYVTYLKGNRSGNPNADHHAHCFWYSENDMRSFGEQTGWKMHYIGDWKHPRKQLIVLYTKGETK